MKTACTSAVLALVLLVLGRGALASYENWMFHVQAGSPDGTDEGLYAQIGVKPTSCDGVDGLDIPYDLSTAVGTEKVAVLQADGITTNVFQERFQISIFTQHGLQVLVH